MLDFSFEPYKHEMLETLKNFIKIESVRAPGLPNAPYGKGIFDALMFVQSTSERLDLDCVNMFGQMAYVDYGYGDEMLGVLMHVDVVPEGEGWTFPAFEGTEKDGKIYGRGTIDNKGPAVAALYALKAIKDNCIQLNKKVRLLFGTDEETTWQDMDFNKQHGGQIPDIAFSPDGEYPIINMEKGAVHFKLDKKCVPTTAQGVRVISFESGTAFNVVPNKAECVIAAPFDIIKRSVQNYTCPAGATFECSETADGNVYIKAVGRSSHGSKPEMGINAAASLLKYLSTLPLASGDAESAVYALADKIGLNYNGEGLGLDVSDESGILTLSIGCVSIKDSMVNTKMDIRYPVSYTLDFVDEQIKKHFPMFDYSHFHCLPTHFVPEDSVLVKTLKETYKEMTGEEPYCISIGGATYARAFENAVTFGPLFPEKPNVEHGPDEYIEIDAFFKNAEIIADAIIKLCGQS
jgi:succinyl-diaminopimelate desuccinylase